MSTHGDTRKAAFEAACQLAGGDVVTKKKRVNPSRRLPP